MFVEVMKKKLVGGPPSPLLKCLISLQTRTKLKKSTKNILSCCKLQIVFKNETILGSNFHFKDQIPNDLTSCVIYKFRCGFCNESYYDECMRHLNVRIGISPLTENKLSLRKAPWPIICKFPTI